MSRSLEVVRTAAGGGVRHEGVDLSDVAIERSDLVRVADEPVRGSALGRALPDLFMLPERSCLWLCIEVGAEALRTWRRTWAVRKWLRNLTGVRRVFSNLLSNYVDPGDASLAREDRAASVEAADHSVDGERLPAALRTRPPLEEHCSHGHSAPPVSVVICTFNRASSARQAIQSVLDQGVSADRYEIIAVDNNSTDDTPMVLKGIAQEVPNLRYVREPRQGLSIARNTGWKEAAAPYVAYLDDDAKAGTGWLEGVLEVLEEEVPTLCAFGGPILPSYSAPKPSWFKDDWEVRSWGSVPRFLGDDETLSGSNVVISRSVLEHLGGFRETLGVKGTKLILGEETELFIRMHEECESPCIYYHPGIVVYHEVPAARMSVRYRLHRAFASGSAAFHCQLGWTVGKRLALLALMPARVAVRLARAFAHVRRHQAPQTWAVEELRPVARALGQAAACVKAPWRNGSRRPGAKRTKRIADD